MSDFLDYGMEELGGAQSEFGHESSFQKFSGGLRGVLGVDKKIE